jgi:hypothetical protein
MRRWQEETYVKNDGTGGLVHDGGVIGRVDCDRKKEKRRRFQVGAGAKVEMRAGWPERLIEYTGVCTKNNAIDRVAL